MKNILILTAIFYISTLNIQLANGQTNPQADSSKITLTSESAINPSNHDIVINMEMIESFRRCYDKIEVVDWAGMFKDASTDDLGTIYLAYRRMQKNSEENINTKNLTVEVEKVKSEIASNTSIRINKNDPQNRLTAANQNSK